MQHVVVAGMPFSGYEWVSDALSQAGVPTVLATPVPVARCTSHAAARALAESLPTDPARAGILLVYRNPWDSSLASLDSEEPRLVSDPGVLRRAWEAYHRAALDYLADSSETIWLVSSDAIASDPSRLDALVDVFPVSSDAPRVAAAAGHQAWGVSSISQISRGGDDAIGGLYRALYPELTNLLSSLSEHSVASCRPGAVSALPRPGHVLAGGSLPQGTGVQVVVPCRNDGRFIAEAVASVARATPEPVELTIVDDGSDDPETLRIMQCLREAGYQVIRTEGVGLGGARNAGTRLSASAVVLPLDADNMVRPAMFEGVGLIAADAADVVYGPAQYFGMKHYVFRPAQLTWSNVLPYNTVDACALVRRDLLERIGGWDPDFRVWEDWELWVSAMELGARFHPVSDITFDYCVRPGSLQRSSGHSRLIRERTHRQLFAKHWASLAPLLLDAFIWFDEERAVVRRDLTRTRTELDLFRQQLGRKVGDR